MLKDEDFVSQVKKKPIKDQILSYAKDEAKFDKNGCIVGDCVFSVNDQLFFETLMMIVREEAISHASFAKKQNVIRGKDREKEIKELERKLIISDEISILKAIN